MKKIYTLFMLMIVSIFAFSASALTFYVTVDNPDNVDFKVNFSSYTLSAGRNTVNSPSGYCPIAISAANGAQILSITCNGNEIGTNVPYRVAAEGEEYVITTQSAGEVQKKHFTVNVTDNPELVWIIKNNDEMSTNLKNTEPSQEIEFSDQDNPFSIKYYWKDNKNYSGRIYEVKVGDSPLTPDANGAFSYTAQDGDVVTVTVNTPAETRYPVHFRLSEGAAGFITGVEIDGETITDWNGDDLNVKAGSAVTVTCDTENFRKESFKINGVESSISNGASTFTVLQETTVEVDARHWYEWTVTLNIDHPELIDAYLGASTGEALTLQAGANPLTVDERNPTVTILPKYGTDITSVTYNGVEVQPQGNEYGVVVTADGIIDIVAALIERNYKATVYVSDITYVDDIFLNRNNVSSSDVRSLQSGYQWVNFYEKDNPHSLLITSGSSDFCLVKRNYEEIERLDLTSNGTYRYLIDIEDGDLIQVYLGHTPIEYNVTFDIEGYVSNLRVTRDYTFDFDPATATDEAISVPEKTVFSIAADTPMTIKVNDATVANGTGSIDLPVGNDDESRDFHIAIFGETDGITATANDGTAAAPLYYNLQGVRIAGEPSEAGVYIRRSNGRTDKIVVK